MSSAAPTLPSAYLHEPHAGRLNTHYAPADGVEILENPPRFTWLPVVEEKARYVLRVSLDPKFPKGATQVFTDLPLNFLTPDTVFAPGHYHWSYAVWDPKKKTAATAFSTVRDFIAAKGLPKVALPGRDARYAKTNMAHPRLWLGPEGLEKFPAT